MVINMRRIATLVGVCAVLTCDVAHAALIIINGRPVDSSDVRGPYAPSSHEECDSFKEDANKTMKVIGEAHDQCLENNRGRGGGLESEARLPDGRKVERCSVLFCQELHTARDEYRDKVRETYSQCLVEVDKRGRGYGSSGASEARTSTTDRDDALSYAMRRLPRGPIEGVLKYVKEKVSDAIDNAINKYFGIDAKFGSQGVKVADATYFFGDNVKKIRADCAEAHDAKVQAQCDEVLIDAFSSLPRKVPTQFRYDPAIELIQRAMMEKLQAVMRDVNTNMREVEQGMNDISDNSSAVPSTSRRRSRTTPLIENR